MYRSTDAGNSWQPLPSGMEPNARVADIVVDPSNPDVIYAADLLSGVYRFVSGSGKWERINHGLKLRSVNALAFAADGSILYAGTEGNGVYRLKLPGHPLAKPLPEQLVGPPIGPPFPDPRPPIRPPFSEPEPPERPPIREGQLTVQVLEPGPRGPLRPVPEAIVVIHHAGKPVAEAPSNNEGQARLTLRQDSYEIRVEKPGYRPHRGPLEFRRPRLLQEVVLERIAPAERPPEERPPGERPPQERPPGERPPASEATLRVRVVERGQRGLAVPVPAARIVIAWAGEPVAEQQANRGGEAVFRLRQGSYAIFVTRPGYAAYEGPLEVRRPSVSRQVVLERRERPERPPQERPPGERPPQERPPGERPPAPEATLRVHVVERGPRGLTVPVPAAQIAIHWAGRPVAEQQANRGGEAVFRLRQGSYAIFVTRPGYARHEGPLEVRQPEAGQTIVLRRVGPR